MNKIIDGFKNMDKSIKRTIIGGIIVVVVLFVIVLIVGTLNNRKLSYDKLEAKIVSAAASYYKDRPEKLPQTEGGEVTLNVKALVESKYLKDLSQYNDDKCDADVYVTKSGEEYLYSTYLNCKEYQTKSLVSYIKENENIVTRKDGLYQYGEELIYRGENVNNYIEFGGQIWRILRINADGTIRVIQNKSSLKAQWDDRYNIDTDQYNGINDFEKSRIRDELLKLEEDSEFLEKDSQRWIVAKNVCIDKKNDINLNNVYSVACTNYSEEKYKFSLLQLEEYFIASIDDHCTSIDSDSCTNYNYLASGRYWTITPSSLNSSRVYTTGGSTSASEASRDYTVRVVTNLSRHVLYSKGDGTADNPYKIK